VPLTRRRRPLLRSAATAGGAYLAGKQRGRNEERDGGREARFSGAERGSATAPREGLSSDAMDQLKSLAELHDQGILTDQEFDEQKAKVLNS